MPSKFVRMHWSNLSRGTLSVFQMVIALPILILGLVAILGLLGGVALVRIFEWALFGLLSGLNKN